jgi:hypothetical protein
LSQLKIGNSAQAEEGKHGNDDHNQTNDVDNIVHRTPLEFDIDMS